MKIAIDVDGVLAEQVPPVLKLLNKQYGLKVTKKQIRTWDEPIADTDIKVEIEANLLRPGFLERMRLVSGAKEAVREIASTNSILIATNRDPLVVDATKKWLIKKGIPFNDFVSTKIEGKGAIDAEILIDDYPGNIKDFYSRGRFAILFDQPWNQDFDFTKAELSSEHVFRAHGWSEALKFVKNIETKSNE